MCNVLLLKAKVRTIFHGHMKMTTPYKHTYIGCDIFKEHQINQYIQSSLIVLLYVGLRMQRLTHLSICHLCLIIPPQHCPAWYNADLVCSRSPQVHILPMPHMDVNTSIKQRT